MINMNLRWLIGCRDAGILAVMIDSNPTRSSSSFGILYLLGCLGAAIVIPPRNSRGI